MYAEVSVIVDGALDATEVFVEQAALDDFVAGVEKDAAADGLPTEVYILWHDHPIIEDECSCVQYLTDHHPECSFNIAE